MNKLKSYGGFLLARLSCCSQRVGRVYDGRMVVCCGYREIEDLEECIECRSNC